MKKVVLIILILMVGIWCMENREKVVVTYDHASKSVKRFLWGTKAVSPEAVVEVNESHPESPKLSPESTAQTLVTPYVPALPIAQELAPDLYFTKERITMMSDEGIQAIPEGVAVHKIGEENGKFIIKDEKVQLVVEPRKLTRDPEEVALLKQRVAALQESIRSSTGATPIDNKKSKIAAPTNKNAPALISSERAQIEATVMGLNRKISELRSYIDQQSEAQKRGRTSSHAAEMTQVRSQISELEKQRTYYIGILKKSR